MERLISRRFPIAEAIAAYDLLSTDRNVLGLVLDYGADTAVATEAESRNISIVAHRSTTSTDTVTIGAIGAGNYAGRVLLPAFAATNARLKTISSNSGISSDHVGKKLGFEINATDTDSVLSDDEINTVVVATRHDTHAQLVIAALKAGKNVFVEKPLALKGDELAAIGEAYHEAERDGVSPKLMVGFNRRFSPFTQKLKSALSQASEPIALVYLCNAGHIPAESWVHDMTQGGGRIVGEACHFIDLARFLAGAPIESVSATGMSGTDEAKNTRDTATITLKFESSSLATIHYFANGSRSFPKERIEVFQGGRVMVLDNFQQLRGYGSGTPRMKALRQKKGQQECCSAYVDAIRSNRPSPIPFSEIMEVSRASIEAAEQLCP